MKRPVFRLKSLLQYRKFMKTQAAARLAEASRKRVQAQESAARASRLLEQMEAELEVSTRSALRASEFMLLQDGLANRRQQVEQARLAYEHALAEEEACRESILKIQKEYESVLKLKEKHAEQVWAEELREDESALNEFTNARFKRASGY
ncbi:MAG: flagellar export protein FliJ [Opitutales bacterium]